MFRSEYLGGVKRNKRGIQKVINEVKGAEEAMVSNDAILGAKG